MTRYRDNTISQNPMCTDQRALAAIASGVWGILVLLSGAIMPGPVAQAQEPIDTSTTIVVGDDAEHSAQQAEIQELMGELAEQMATIRVTRDREERQRLMGAHRDKMREALGQMREMGGTAMQAMIAEHMRVQDRVSPDTKEPAHRHKQPPISRAGRSSGGPRLTDLELRIDMMQVIMESLIEQCAAPQ